MDNLPLCPLLNLVLEVSFLFFSESLRVPLEATFLLSPPRDILERLVGLSPSKVVPTSVAFLLATSLALSWLAPACDPGVGGLPTQFGGSGL